MCVCVCCACALASSDCYVELNRCVRLPSSPACPPSSYLTLFAPWFLRVSGFGQHDGPTRAQGPAKLISRLGGEACPASRLPDRHRRRTSNAEKRDSAWNATAESGTSRSRPLGRASGPAEFCFPLPSGDTSRGPSYRSRPPRRRGRLRLRQPPELRLRVRPEGDHGGGPERTREGSPAEGESEREPRRPTSREARRGGTGSGSGPAVPPDRGHRCGCASPYDAGPGRRGAS